MTSDNICRKFHKRFISLGLIHCLFNKLYSPTRDITFSTSLSVSLLYSFFLSSLVSSPFCISCSSYYSLCVTYFCANVFSTQTTSFERACPIGRRYSIYLYLSLFLISDSVMISRYLGVTCGSRRFPSCTSTRCDFTRNSKSVLFGSVFPFPCPRLS